LNRPIVARTFLRFSFHRKQFRRALELANALTNMFKMSIIIPVFILNFPLIIKESENIF